jgi:hypothetical protein
MRQAPFTKEIINDEMKKGSLFLLEKNLDRLPDDWIDCIMFIHRNGMSEEPLFPLMIIDGDKEFETINNLVEKKDHKLIIFSHDKKKVWNAMLLKNDDNEAWVCGGENLRLFCDERNIFYKSMTASDGSLLSATNMKFTKNKNDDCRHPENIN